MNETWIRQFISSLPTTNCATSSQMINQKTELTLQNISDFKSVSNGLLYH